MEQEFSNEDIEEYIHNRMEKGEREVLETKMAASPALAERVRFFHQLQQAFHNLAEKELLAVVDEAKAELKAEGLLSPDGIEDTETAEKPLVLAKPRRIKLRVLLAFAASVLLLIAAGTIWHTNQRYSDHGLARHYWQYEIPPAPNRKTGEPAPDSSPLSQGLEGFENGRWDESIATFKSIPENSPQYIEARFYLAQINFRQKNYAEAAGNFEAVRASGDVRYRENADWMLLLSRLAAGQKDQEVQKLLDELTANPAHVFRQSALDLQADLESGWRALVW